MSRLPRGVLFDLDDTLIAYDEVADVAWSAVCEAHSPDAAGAQALLAAIDRHRSWYWSDPDRHQRGRRDLQAARVQIIGAALTELGRADAELARNIAVAYADTRTRAIHLLPGALEVLSVFVELEIPLVLVTNGTQEGQRAKIERFSLDGYFRGIFIEGEVGVGKPAREIYERALDALGVPAAEVWSVGDNPEWDVFAPQRLGMTGIWRDYGGRILPDDAGQKPDHTISGVSDLLDLLPPQGV